MFWKSRQEQQFAALVREQGPALYRLAYGRLGNRHDSEDVLQETFLKAYRSLTNFRQGTNAQAWLTTILINTIRDHVRRAVRAPHIASLEEVSETDPAVTEDQQTASPEQVLSDAEIDPDLQQALRSLPDNFLVPVLLRDLHDLTYEQIAQVIDAPIGTVMSRLSRGRQMLRTKLKEAAARKVSEMRASSVGKQKTVIRGFGNEV